MKPVDAQHQYIYIGTPVPSPSEEGTIKSTAIWEQEARDESGRKRFHGAFTGGFSAGYFNTVGSREGWTPTAFISSRSKKNELTLGKEAIDEPPSNPTQYELEKYMDEEDKADMHILKLSSHLPVRETSITASFNLQPKSTTYMTSLDSKSRDFKLSILYSLLHEARQLKFSTSLLYDAATDIKRSIRGQNSPSSMVNFSDEEDEEDTRNVRDLYGIHKNSKYDSMQLVGGTRPDLSSTLREEPQNLSRKGAISGFIPTDFVPSRIKLLQGRKILHDKLQQENKESSILNNTDQLVEDILNDYMLTSSSIAARALAVAVSSKLKSDLEQISSQRYLAYLQYQLQALKNPSDEKAAERKAIFIDLYNGRSGVDIPNLSHDLESFYKMATFFQPLSTSMNDRFISGGLSGYKPLPASDSKDRKKKEFKEEILLEPVVSTPATKGKFTTDIFLWAPSALLCRRLGLPELNPIAENSGTSSKQHYITPKQVQPLLNEATLENLQSSMSQKKDLERSISVDKNIIENDNNSPCATNVSLFDIGMNWENQDDRLSLWQQEEKKINSSSATFFPPASISFPNSNDSIEHKPGLRFVPANKRRLAKSS